VFFAARGELVEPCGLKQYFLALLDFLPLKIKLKSPKNLIKPFPY